MEKSRITYADLHFHTNYSDNRDSATAEQMMRAGNALGISCFGSGDHNHNLSAEAWSAQQMECEQLQRKYPQFQIMHNCELTFRLGHALIIKPEKIT
ncbi:MAG: histidinol phosphatase, partial [Spirochaetales bacterium]|nr:histidinol phosphatase [Spirochaetales bacterium]